MSFTSKRCAYIQRDIGISSMVLRDWNLRILVLIQSLKSLCIMHSANRGKKRNCPLIPDMTFYEIYLACY